MPYTYRRREAREDALRGDRVLGARARRLVDGEVVLEAARAEGHEPALGRGGDELRVGVRAERRRRLGRRGGGRPVGVGGRRLGHQEEEDLLVVRHRLEL